MSPSHSTLSPSSQPVAKILIGKVGMALLPPELSFIKPLLEHNRKAFDSEGLTGVRQVNEIIGSWDTDIKGRIAFPTGLLHRVVNALQDSGYAVSIEDMRDPAPDIAQSLMDATSPEE